MQKINIKESIKLLRELLPETPKKKSGRFLMNNTIEYFMKELCANAIEERLVRDWLDRFSIAHPTVNITNAFKDFVIGLRTVPKLEKASTYVDNKQCRLLKKK